MNITQFKQLEQNEKEVIYSLLTPENELFLYEYDFYNITTKQNDIKANSILSFANNITDIKSFIEVNIKSYSNDSHSNEEIESISVSYDKMVEKYGN